MENWSDMEIPSISQSLLQVQEPYTISARAYDNTGWVRTNLEQVEENVSWTVNITVGKASAGDDAITGTLFGDYLMGLSGNDVITGEDGDDAIFGDGGNDTLDGGNGNDRMQGGGVMIF